MELPTRCARPTLGHRGVSTYTVLGFVGYAVGNAVVALLMVMWGMSITERVIAAFVPPLTFLVVVRAMRKLVGHERIVFYEITATSLVVVGVVGAVVGANVARLLDAVTIGIGVFLIFGRLGCFAVACCHGRPARFGVVYGPDHVRIGFWARWAGRRLWPVQLVESAASALLVTVALLVGSSSPGLPTMIYLLGYAVARFALELVRGDSARPVALGISEAQWTALATSVACACWRPSLASIGVASLLALSTVVLVARHRRRAWFQPAHLYELARLCDGALRQPAVGKQTSSLGMSVSCHALGDGRVDWVMSASSKQWSPQTARRIAADLWPTFELVEGRLPDVVHVVANA